ncbi:MAG TPA: hypothetical protein VF359_08415 [Anaerolineales bacterium]
MKNLSMKIPFSRQKGCSSPHTPPIARGRPAPSMRGGRINRPAATSTT